MRHNKCNQERDYRKFLLTHLMRGATVLKPLAKWAIENFYSRTSCEVRPAEELNNLYLTSHFYSRTSCEVRLHTEEVQAEVIPFLLTHLMRGATATTFLKLIQMENFYSRTSCEVRQVRFQFVTYGVYFYSRTSCEVRHVTKHSRKPHAKLFLLTHLMRGATMNFSSP